MLSPLRSRQGSGYGLDSAPRAIDLDPHRSAGVFRAPVFGRRRAIVSWLQAEGLVDAVSDGLAAARPDAALRQALAMLRAARVGGTPGLPDPGAEAIGHGRGAAVLVVDPCDPALAGAAARMLEAARRAAAGRPVLVAASPAAPPAARSTLPVTLPGRLAPWTLLDLAAELHALGDELGILALAAGVPLRDHAGAPWAGPPPEHALAALFGATRWEDPFRGTPWTAAEGLAQLAAWREAEAANRRIRACVGIEWFKHRHIRDALASAAGPPRMLMRGSSAIRVARRERGAVAVWASVMPAALPARAAAAGVPLVRLEDGFIRSAGLGVLLAPAASLAIDGQGIHYDPGSESALEALLARAEFAPALLERAARLRQALLAAGITKYNLAGAAPALALPPGRRVILVPGQVEDDAAMRLGGARLRTNLALLAAVRRENPDAVILYKPHPDVEAGMRRGAIPPAAAAALADHVLAAVPIGALYGLVEEVHTIASLAGFEALLRGLRVVTHGQPFYAGWGLTEDRDPPLRRGRRLGLDALVAAALILHLRCIDPVTGLPCPPELLVERLAQAPPRPARRHPVPAPLRAFTARVSRFLAGWWAAR
jgi:capsular polysaccharide export protein